MTDKESGASATADHKDGFRGDGCDSSTRMCADSFAGLVHLTKESPGTNRKPRSVIISTCRDVVHSTRYHHFPNSSLSS